MSLEKKITHLTVLNPAIHTRIFYKLALSQRELGYSVSIIGQSATVGRFEQEGVQIISTGKFSRLSFKRIFAGFRIFRLASREKADAFCIHTPELLWVGLLLKGLTGAKLLYDMHEDYRATIRHGGQYARLIRRPLAAGLRLWERICMRWIDGLSYAEMSYENVLRAAEGKYVVLRNTFRGESREQRVESREQRVESREQRVERREAGGEILLTANSHLPTMLYTGTLAADWGIWETISWWEKFNQIRPLELKMAGFSFDKAFIQEIRTRIAATPFSDRFELIGGTEYVPHEQIVDLIRNCTFGTAFYQLKPHIIGKIPTKFYEYMAFDKPLLFTPEACWEAFDQKYQLGISLSGNENPAEILQRLDAWQAVHQPADYSWENDKWMMADWLEDVL